MSLPHQVCNAVARSRMPGRGVLRLAAHMRSKSSLSMSSPSGMEDAGNTVLFKLRSSLIAAASLGMDQASKFSLMEVRRLLARSLARSPISAVSRAALSLSLAPRRTVRLTRRQGMSCHG